MTSGFPVPRNDERVPLRAAGLDGFRLERLDAGEAQDRSSRRLLRSERLNVLSLDARQG
jgi:hypothetical protein